MNWSQRDYDRYIADIAKKLYSGEPITISINDELREEIVDYGNKYRNNVKRILSDIGYECYMTCTNYDAVDEVLSIIKGEPYFEYIANEANDDKIIKVHYYLHLLKSPIVNTKQFIYGKYYNITFNALNHEMSIVDDVDYKIQLQKSYLLKSGYSKLYFQALTIE